MVSLQTRGARNPCAGLECETPMRHRLGLRALVLLAATAIASAGALAAAATFQRVRLMWVAYDGAPDLVDSEKRAYPATNLFTVVARHRASGTLPRVRARELAEHRLVVQAVDTQGSVRYEAAIADPRVLRTELPGPEGQLSRQVLHRAKVTFEVAVPDDPAITQLRLYHPRWTGTLYDLDLLGSVTLRTTSADGPERAR